MKAQKLHSKNWKEYRKNNKGKLKDLLDNIKPTNVYNIGTPEQEEENKGHKT